MKRIRPANSLKNRAAAIVPPTKLLDVFPGAAGGWGVRKLSDSPANVSGIRIRRDIDNAELDCGWDAATGFLKISTIENFCSDPPGHVSGYVVKVYDQSGNGNDLVQATAANQPKLVSNGVCNLLGGHPAITFDNATDFFTLSVSLSGTSPWSTFKVMKKTQAADKGLALTSAAAPGVYASYHYSDNGIYCAGADQQRNTGAYNTINQQLYTGLYTVLAAGRGEYVNGTFVANTGFANNATPSTFDNFGKRGAEAQGGTFQELVFYNLDKTADKVGIETNINAGYTLF